MFEFLRKILSKGQQEARPPMDIEELRTTFKARYHHFKLLLNANNKALEMMTEMERALHGNRPFGMSFVRANCTAISANVFQIVKNLNELAPGNYEELYERFREIQEDISHELNAREQPKGDRLVIPLAEMDRHMADQVGNKMANLGEVRNQVHLPVPPGFAITSLAYHRLMEHNKLQVEIDRRIQSSVAERMDELFRLSADIQQLIIRSEVPEDLKEAILRAHAEIEREVGTGVRVSLRSSALGEDMAGTSFAGQYRSELNVSVEHILHAYKEILASKYSLQAMTYRLNRGIRDEHVSMSVGCMAMVNAAAGGVMYSCNPMNIRDTSVIINSVWGLPKSVVDGSVTPDMIAVSREEPIRIVEKDIRVKDRKFVCYPDEGVCRLDLTGEDSTLPSITDDQAVELCRLALKLEDYYGSPQDIEWAIDTDGTIVVLQCRPLQQVESPRPTAVRSAQAPADDSVILQGGVTASPGIACGPVYIVRKDMDALQFPEGGVLVTSQPLPRWASMLNRASAVITEQGSVAGHLANVAREFEVPALFSIPQATEKLKHGDLITVDAEGLKIFKGRVESLLSIRSGVKKNLMAGSPVYELLETVSSHIIPLNLLDPDSTDFRPRNCKTFHDITRFCHEKSVQEVFNFGKEHHFSERSSKQLFCKVPMQFWLINLDDGFKGEAGKKFVLLENIASIPMLALWEGMTAIPWGGPPPVDTKGFMSVLMQATTNPALDPSMKSDYAARNYFMISKNFCNLSSRFGFHFSTVEALVGERPSENYISFQFKGGAADYPRRVRRAVFVGDILENYGFRVEVKEDAAFARIEGHEQEFMEKRLVILGYLIIHTRQLDMIMSSNAAVSSHKIKLLNDIESILKGEHNSRECPSG